MNFLKLSCTIGSLLAIIPFVCSAGLDDIQSRIDAQVKAGGGKVTIPSGIWVTGPIKLSSNIELHLEEGAKLKFPDTPELYWDEASAKMRPLVGAVCSTNVSITGSGTLEACADLNLVR